MKNKYLLLVLMMSVFSAQAQFKTMRCGTKVVSVGERVFEVERKCGIPDTQLFVGFTGDGSSEGNVPIEEWIYNQTTGSATAYSLLRFEGGKLVSIESYFPTN
ncbi:DUF2845 domain-containing protein [Entomomonas asaccharolytica]|uniref:DUF2845 domain-containing protein n=1 Tax=Entomomonas asaccharolytica TaxID=2785331 RepID=A0A974RW96_9GAMM|nr:DUF2845 domain-containing protein [Entomomonas asaccharolytica]QQP84963.1 DUF2845 domain-containing protein [Entomomonas asaccharolytica]